MFRTNPAGRGARWLRGLAALLGVALIVVTVLGFAHCSYNHGMSPDFCAMLAVAIILPALLGPLLSGRVPSDSVPAFVPVTLRPFYRPPRLSRA